MNLGVNPLLQFGLEETRNRIINTILFSGNEAELRESMRQLEKKTPLDEYFTYGYGARHLWVCQRRPSDKTKIFEHRIMMVEFQ